MQKISKIKIGKSITAVLLCVVLLVTSIPMVLAAGEGEYDPIPTFTESDKREAAATLNDDGGITVSFPAAKVSERKTGTKTIDGYMLELVDLGTYTEVHTSTVLLRKMVSPTGTAPYTAEITADEIKTKVPAGLSDDHRYNITITAYDSDGWFSEAVNAYVSDVPTYVYDASAYAPVTNNVLAVREVLTFDKKGTADDHGSFSDTGINERTAEVNNVRSTSGSLDYMQEGNHLSVEGRTDGVGVKDTGNSYGYAMRIESAATTDSPQSFDTSWSRQTWDPTGASEIWYYLDFSEVSVTGLSFRLRANEKYFAQDFDNSYSESSNAFNRYGDIIYSTVGTTKAGYMGEAPYLFLQQTDGSWKKVMLNDGTVDLDHFKGYVRIPLQFMCSETDSVVTESNEDFGVNKPMPDMYVWNSSDKTKANANKYYNEKIKLSQPVVVDPAGTSISDALLIRRYSFRINKTSTLSGEYYIDGGTMLAPCMATEDGGKTTANSPKRAYIDKTKIGTGEDPVVNRTNAFKAIEDIMSAGFKFTGCSYDPASTSLETNNGSVGKKIFLDNVLFYRTDGQKYSENTLNGETNTGTPVKTYYDQETEIPRAIFNACQKYIEDPNSYDYRAVKYIEDLIAGYKKSIEEYNKSEEAGKSGIIDASFLEDSALDTKAAALGMTEAWEKYKTAKQACIDGKTYGSANSGAEDFIPMISTKLEQLPDFDENTLAVSDEDKAVVKSLYEVYIRLNLSQLTMLGRAEEEKLLKYFSFIEEELADNSVVIGQALTNNKVIPFGDFDSLEKGTRSWQFENSKYTGQVGKDYYYSKGYLTYQVPFASLSAHSQDTATPTLIPTGALGSDPQRNGITSYRQNGTSAIITSNGLEGKNAATVTINNQYAEDRKGWYNCISITKGLVDKEPSSSGDYSALRANNMSSESLGDFAKSYTKNDIGETDRLALVFYADFSQLDTFSMAFNISSYYEGAAEDYTLDFGSNNAASYFYLINPKTGEWAKCIPKDESKRRIYAYTSEYGIDTGDGDYLTLSHYKGYVMVPLFQFSRGVQGISATSNYRIDEKAESLNNIFRVTIGIAPLSNYDDSSVNGKSAAAMNGKSFTIGSVGFTYRQGTSAYGAGVQNRTGDVSFDDYAQVKSLTSMQFENAVADVDIYKANTRTEKINKALALYAQLSDYQKTIPSVARAYSVLQKYKSIDDGITLLDQPQIAVADLKPLIEAMPAAATGGSVTDSNALPYPGFVIGTDESGTEKPLINYGAYSITAADVQNIINWYEQSYERYTDEAIAALGTENVTKMENLYKVAKRLRLLESYRDGYTSDSGTAITGIKDLNALVASMYGETGKATDLTTDCRLMPTGQTAALENYLEKYNDLDYYAKYILTDKADKFASAPQYKNYAKAAEAVNKVLANIKTYTDDITGKTVKGGVVRLEEKYTALYNTVKGQMDNSGIQDLTAITEAVEEYNSFKGYIRQVQEVNDGNTVNSSDGEALHGIIDTLRIFPNFASEVDKDSVALNKDATTGTAVFTLSNAVNYPDGSYTLRVTSKNGGLKDVSGNILDYNVAMTGAIEKTVTAKALNTSPETADVANNTASAAAPKAINFTFTVTGVTVTSEDVITIELIDNATGEVAVDKTTNEPVRKTINIHFAADDFFEVTIPAEIDVPWGETEPVDVSYKVTSSLDTGSKIGVSVARSASVANDTLTNAATSTYALPYTSQNFTSTEFTGTNEGALPAQKPSLTISGWTDAPIAEYSTTLTYTVDYTKG
ncbi:unknown [Eubacterium sp. CAG:180]|nr:unknown [Eubacterium sp. CAG:180]